MSAQRDVVPAVQPATVESPCFVVRDGPSAIVARAADLVLVIRPPGASVDDLCRLASLVLADTELEAMRASLAAYGGR